MFEGVSGSIVVVLALVLLAVIVLAKTAIVVPQQSAYVVERLGRYAGTLDAGFHILTPFVDVVRYRHSLKERAIDIPEQICITRDNVQVGVDAVLYLRVLNAERASYGITDFIFAITQLAQTTLRSDIGKIDLDKTFEERSKINLSVVSELDKATEAWGVKVMRYEIKNINPPQDVLSAMEKQMRAEREKRAVILNSEGARDAAINNAEGDKQKAIKASEGRKQQQINEAEGQAAAILSVATATAEGIRQIAEAIQNPGGLQAVQLRVAEQYIQQFGNIAKAGNTLVVPSNLSDVGGLITMAMNIVKQGSAPAGQRRLMRPRHRVRLFRSLHQCRERADGRVKMSMRRTFLNLPRSSNGRTAAFGAVNRGSNPCRGANLKAPTPNLSSYMASSRACMRSHSSCQDLMVRCCIRSSCSTENSSS